jgi:hypothetical protein
VNLIDRIDMACNHANILMKDIAETLGIHKNTMYAMKRGRMQIGPYAKRISEILQVPQEWLEHGTGPAPAWFQAPESILPAPPDQAQVQVEILKTLQEILSHLKNNDGEIMEIRRAVTRLEVRKSPARLIDQDEETQVKSRTG